MLLKNIIPKQIQQIIEHLKNAGFETYLVGGCVRDILRNIAPKDWDITTSAQPDQIQKTFRKSGFKTVYENDFGTVAVITKSKEPSLKTIEITPYRTEAKYSDKRHPDEIKWAKTLKQDLARRDFTVNAIALELTDTEGVKIKDPLNGRTDLAQKVIRAVGKPDQRFSEDGLRLIRAVRFAVSLDRAVWSIEEKTKKAIAKNVKLLSFISQERIRDELIKIIKSSNAGKGIELLRRLGLLKYIIPELEFGFGVEQNKHHVFQIYQHNLLSLNYACENNFSFEVRMASLLHDIGKPQTKRGKGYNATFHHHELAGASIARKVLKRLRFSRKDIDKITKLVKFHLFYYNVDEVGPASVRRLLRKVGQENIEELLQVRYADRIGSGVAKAEPYKLRHLKYLMEKVSKDPISVKMLKINGDQIMEMLNIKPGHKVGHILTCLLSDVLSDPKNNVLPYLKQKTKELNKLSDAELKNQAQLAEREINTVKMKQDKMTKAKYWVS